MQSMVQALFEFNYGLFNKSENCRASALMDSTLTCRFQLSSHETTQYYSLLEKRRPTAAFS